ncbi:MAG: hypothetical protein COA78_05475 [Blastopirellula sp.]|nr:MAG: hypothetical protein COA78_05475 [Blastopirellula sp.]
MNRWQLVFRSLTHHRKIHFSVALGVIAATAVLTGALLVGDSVRGSLRDLALDRLGQIDSVILADRFFAEQTVAEMQANAQFQDKFSSALPVIYLQGTLEKKDSENDLTRRAGSVAVLGIDSDFWETGDVEGLDSTTLNEDEIILNEPLAEELQAKVGDQITLRLPTGNDVPADSPLGKKNDRTRSLPRLIVKAVIPAEGLGRFGLHPSQQLPMNAFVSRTRLQKALKQEDKVNAVFVTANDSEKFVASGRDILKQTFQPTLEDFGVNIDRVSRTFTDEATGQTTNVYDYYQLTSSRMMFNHVAEATIRESLESKLKSKLADKKLIPIYTYLATSIGKGQGGSQELGEPAETVIPYSTITAIDLTNDLTKFPYPLFDNQQQPITQLAADEIVLNSWSANRLDAKIDDLIYVSYFNPESTHGEAEETTATFRLVAITPLTEPSEPYSRKGDAVYDKRPTTANDTQLTPEVAGITDQESLDDWDPPFPFDNSRVKDEDEDYWDNYRTTPKAFISFEAGKELWGSRFGQVTSFRIPVTDGVTKDSLREKLEPALRAKREAIGFRTLAVKHDALQAASGTTPFNVLFVGFSFFIIAAALMLVSLLFKLGIEQRASEIGTLLALGINRKVTASLLVREGLIVASAGSFIGTLVGIGYAWLMLVGLRSWWLEAVVTPFLFLKLDNPATLVIGFFSGSIISLLTIYWAVRQLRNVSLRSLIAGQAEPPAIVVVKGQSRFGKASLILLGIAVIAAIAATQLAGEAQAGAFFAAGAAVLTALMLVIRRHLRLRSVQVSHASGFSLFQLATSNAARNPSRSTLTIGLMASACFLIIAISSFRLSPSEQGAGGMDLMAESSQPIYHNINTEDGRYELGFVQADEPLISASSILSLRVQPGDDASCLNLYQSKSPRVLGVTPAMIEHYSQTDITSFAWAGSAASTDQEKQNPWLVLNKVADGIEEPIPVVLDKNTAMYALHLYSGIGEEFTTTDDDGRETRYEVAGLLSNSIFQGNLLVGEQNFLGRFPDVNGYRMFLIQSPSEKSEEVAQLLEDRLSNEGFDTISTTRKLTSLLAVQNTYLSTFQSLGALGLLLGTFGLATVQMRSVFERRGELALMRAAGFRKATLAKMVLIENSLLLLAGLCTGAFAALVAVLPHMLIGGASVPFDTLSWMLLTITIVGLATGLLTVRSTLKTPLLASLKGE